MEFTQFHRTGRTTPLIIYVAWYGWRTSWGFRSRTDYKAIVDGYAPVKLNGHL
ncbi:hypothetical protein ACFXPW_07175 [Streptomyces goshikiensis]|uniref:hypothetical protein n=1 Tax=Streptomyces goshikiensis TaxID=1942 RepID=UPI0036B67629